MFLCEFPEVHQHVLSRTISTRHRQQTSRAGDRVRVTIPQKVPSRVTIPRKVPARVTIPQKVPARVTIPQKVLARVTIPQKVPARSLGPYTNHGIYVC